MELKIENIAELGRLRLRPEEKKKLEKDLAAILDYVKKLEALDTTDVEPTSHVLDLKDVYRSDEVRPCKIRDEVLEHAPSREGKFFKVPKVVEQE